MAGLCRIGSSWAFGSVFFCFTGVSWFVLPLFLSICGVIWDLFLCWAPSSLSLCVVLLSHELSSLLLCFFASLLLCFSSALLLSVNRSFNPLCGVILLFYILS